MGVEKIGGLFLRIKEALTDHGLYPGIKF